MSPTYETVLAFAKDVEALNAQDRARLVAAVRHFVDDLRAGTGFRPGLRVKRVKGTSGVWEMTFAPDGRATFQYGPEHVIGEPHVVWRRAGTHDILSRP